MHDFAAEALTRGGLVKELLIPMEMADRRLAAIQHGVLRPPEATALSHLGDRIRSAATFCDGCFDETRVTTSLRGPALAPAVLAKYRGMTVGDVVANRDRELQRLGPKGMVRLAGC